MRCDAACRDSDVLGGEHRWQALPFSLIKGIAQEMGADSRALLAPSPLSELFPFWVQDQTEQLLPGSLPHRAAPRLALPALSKLAEAQRVEMQTPEPEQGRNRETWTVFLLCCKLVGPFSTHFLGLYVGSGAVVSFQVFCVALQVYFSLGGTQQKLFLHPRW